MRNRRSFWRDFLCLVLSVLIPAVSLQMFSLSASAQSSTGSYRICILDDALLRVGTDMADTDLSSLAQMYRSAGHDVRFITIDGLLDTQVFNAGNCDILILNGPNFPLGGFVKKMGCTLQHYIAAEKVEKSIEMLRNEDISVSELAVRLGYSDVQSFSKVFKRIKGLTPKLYLENGYSS